MADETTMDPEGSRRLFKTVADVAGDVRSALDRVTNVRAGAAEPWGTDEYGKRFSQQREPTAVETLQGVRELITSVGEVGAAGQEAVENFVLTDTESARRVARRQ
jgi:hypothetical protein